MTPFFFWFFILVLFYTYLGYPLLLWIAARFFGRKVNKGYYEPKVSIILSAFNEEKYIEKKLINLLDLDYPENKIEILVGSDGAEDRTDTIVSNFRSPRIRFFRFVANRGKPQVLNALVEEAQEAILIFTDARQELARDAIRALVENFHDPQVGCVSGELHFRDIQKEGLGKGLDVYWRYEKFLRKHESQVGSMLGATGALYAIRRRLFFPLPLNILVDDMYVPLAVVNRGYRAVFESRAAAFDRTSARGGEEFKRKVRTLVGNYQIFRLFGRLFNPLRSPIAWQFFSHKCLRLLAPFFLIGFFLTNGFLLGQPFYRAAFAVQVIFYGLALAEAIQDFSQSSARAGGRKKNLGTMAYTFCLLNASAFVALFKFLSKRQNGSWEKAYA